MLKIFEQVETKSVEAHKVFLDHQATIADTIMKSFDSLKNDESQCENMMMI